MKYWYDRESCQLPLCLQLQYLLFLVLKFVILAASQYENTTLKGGTSSLCAVLFLATPKHKGARFTHLRL